MSRFLGDESSREAGPRRRRKLVLGYEKLEDRALMSFSLLSSLVPSAPATVPPLYPSIVSSELPKNASGRIMGLYELSLTHHPSYQSVVGSRVLKAPMFYSSYTGPKYAGLDVLGANAVINAQQQIEFTGLVLGPINLSQTAFYSFLVDRGGASSPGLIQGQPRVLFDAMVQVTTGPEGTSATVALLDSQGQPTSTMELPSSLVQIEGAKVNVTVPLSLLPSTATAGQHGKRSHYSYAFSTSVAGTAESEIAGFAPEYTMAPITVSHARKR